MSTVSAGKKKRRHLATVPPEEILPIIDRDYQSRVKGIYVIGDATGVPLVKVATQQGVEVIEAMVRKGEFRGANSSADQLDLVIIGAGPAGLSAALEAQQRRLQYRVLERAHTANTIREFPAGKMVYAEPQDLENRSRLPVDQDCPKDEFLAVVDRTIESAGLVIDEGVEVRQIRRLASHRFEIETGDGRTIGARNVIIAVGRQGEERRLGIPGEELSDKVGHRLHNADDYRDQDVLVVGGGNSAVEAALMLAERNRVTLSYRKDSFFRLKADNQRAIQEAMQSGRVEVLFESDLERIGTDEVQIRIGGESTALRNDSVLILIGTLPAIDFFLDAGLELDGIWNLRRIIWCGVGVLLAYFVYFHLKNYTLLESGSGATHIPGFSWLFELLHPRFANLYAFYYLLYFLGIAVFGLYWAVRLKNRIVWRRNLANIFFNWTLWWGVPTFLVMLLGRNPWTPLSLKTLNAWPLNMSAFDLDPIAGQGDPGWWTTAAIFGVVWAVLLTFVVLPVFTLLVGKYYCSHVCSCGALAETVGHAFRHRGPKGDRSRWLERFGFVFVLLAGIVTVLHLLGYPVLRGYYNVWVGSLLAGALAIGLYPFLGQRIWCRYWCPLAFWMNFWGRWSRFKISAVPGKCIDCNICNQYCQMGIDIKARALRGEPVTLKDTPCVGCGECVVRCPMNVLHLGEIDPKE